MTVFLVYTFKDPALLGRVVDRLAPHPVIVHVDRKVDERPFRDAVATAGARVEFIEDRVLVNWAGWSQQVAIRRLVARALGRVRDDEYVVMLSGSDYPLRPVDRLDAFLAERPGHQHLRAFDVVQSGSDHYRAEMERRHFRDLPLLRRWTPRPRVRRLRNAVIRSLEAAARILPPRTPPPGVVLAHGGTHFALTAGCLRALEAAVTPEVVRYFSRGVFCPEESFYHSLLAGGVGARWGWHPVPFEGRGQHQYANLHHIEPSLEKVYRAADWAEVRGIDRFFLRKVQSEPSAALLDLIDEELLGRSPR